MTSLRDNTGVVLQAELSDARPLNHSTQHDTDEFPLPNAANSDEQPEGQSGFGGVVVKAKGWHEGSCEDGARTAL